MNKEKRLELAKEAVKRRYPTAYAHPTAWGWWIMTGTGCTMGAARTEAEAWFSSDKMLERGDVWSLDMLRGGRLAY